MLSHFGESVRSHWGIKTRLHSVLNVGFREDDCRIRKDHAPQNFAIQKRHLAQSFESTKNLKK